MKTLFTLCLCALATIGFSQIEIENPGFEEWELINTWNLTPVGWTTQNWQLLENTTIDSMACEDELAMRVEAMYGIETAMGVAYTVSETDFIPPNFGFCVKTNVAEGDSVSVRLSFWNTAGNDGLLVYEKVWYTTESMEEWTDILVPLEQIEPVMHEVKIEVRCGYPDPLGGENLESWISVDKMAFDVADAIEEPKCNQFRIDQRNSEIAVVTDCGQVSGRLRLYDLSGRIVCETGGDPISVAGLRPGLYLLSIADKNSVLFTTKLFVQD